jgi:DNA-binding NtrC family response regulator
MAKRKKKTTDLDYWLGSTVTPVFALDSERRIRAFNAGCQSLTGWAPGDVLGETCHYGSVSEIAGAAALAASLCPPPEVFAGKEASVPAQLAHQAGHTLPRMLHFFPLRDEKGRLNGVLGIVADEIVPVRAVDALSARELHSELAALRSRMRLRFVSNTIVAQSLAMRRVLAQLQIGMQSQVAVLFSGGPGSGKEHLARIVHFGGAVRSSAFIPLDCRRLGADEIIRVWNRILDSRRADSTPGGAVGLLPGTVFLAEVEFLPRDLQERLALLFAEPGPLRLLASTCLTPAELHAHVNLRPDFHALISPLTIELPSLSKRLDDLPLLAQHFLEELNRQDPKQVGGFDAEVWPLFARHAWPGNLDELASVVSEAHAHATEALIRPQDLPYRFRTCLSAQELPPATEPPPLLLDPLLTKVERQLIGLALKRSRNNRSKAAELLGITRARLLRRIEQLQIRPDSSSAPDLAAEAVPDDKPPDDLTEP